jgi:2-polyprenyl-6-methoxyphenol hydroxylase-like FAD-dependent oxidoreductase
MLNREDYWQCAFVIAKGGFEEVRRRGLPAFREEIARLVPCLRDRVSELRDWDDVKLLSVTVDRLRVWHRPGLLCIGDAAHAMSPIGGVGINLAIQDAVAAANILYRPLLSQVTENDLRAVQRRRQFPTKATQKMQLIAQKRLIGRVLAGREQLKAPLLLRLASRRPCIKRLVARIIGLGFRPEHVNVPAARS